MIEISGYNFEGPYSSTANVEDKAGIYVILCDSTSKYILIDCGESATVKSRIDTHDRKDCWKLNCSGTLCVAVYYTPNMQQSERIAIEQQIRRGYDPPCGKR